MALKNEINIRTNLQTIHHNLPKDTTLVCISKFHQTNAIMEAYNEGERDFGENFVQELIPKYQALPKDIRWHFTGHLQTNKVKYVIPFIYLIQSVDSMHLLNTIQVLSCKMNKTTNVLLEVHVAQETSKSGFSVAQIQQIDSRNYPNISIQGIMGMASNTKNEEEIRKCFRQIISCSTLFPGIRSFGMSEDYKIAIEEGSNMVRIGSAIFGQRI